jgi:HTH-type transcriptional regulator/antitoxin HigA
MKVSVVAIESGRDYARAKHLASELMRSRRKEDIARLRAQAALIAAWEARRFPVRAVDPVDAIKFRLEQMGLGQAHLARVLGSRPRASEILARRRRLTLPMIKKLRDALDIPADSLIA